MTSGSAQLSYFFAAIAAVASWQGLSPKAQLFEAMRIALQDRAQISKAANQVLCSFFGLDGLAMVLRLEGEGPRREDVLVVAEYMSSVAREICSRVAAEDEQALKMIEEGRRILSLDSIAALTNGDRR